MLGIINTSTFKRTLLKVHRVKAKDLIFKRRIRRIGPKIDIGCKKNPAPGHVGLDIVDFGQDIVWDIGDGLPFPDNSIESVNMFHFVEHLTREECAILFNELLRVCRPNAVIGISVPHEGTKEAYYPTHVSTWTALKFTGLVEGSNGPVPKGGKCFLVQKLERKEWLNVHLKVIIK